MELVTVQKGEVLQDAGVRKVYAYQVVKGLLRSYFLDKLGKEHTFLFAPEGWVIADLYATGFGKESHLVIEALENSEVYVFPVGASKEEHQVKSDNRFKMMHRRAGAMQQRVLMMMSTSALERYEYFLETYPELAERISQKLIASYLGITPQALSKLRRDRVMPDRS
jgi:CRP-like cAMP-binding protein